MYPMAAVLEMGHGLAGAVDAACPNRPGPAFRRREHSTVTRAPGYHPGETGREGQPWGSSRAQHRAWCRECDPSDLGCNRRRPWGSSWPSLAHGDSSAASAWPTANTAIGKVKSASVERRPSLNRSRLGPVDLRLLLQCLQPYPVPRGTLSGANSVRSSS